MVYHLAIDIGASSGRHFLAHRAGDDLVLEEIYRFENGIHRENGALVWDIDHLTQEVKNGLRRAKELGKIPATVAVDTWGVDYALLDENGDLMRPVYSYRDSRTEAAVPAVEAVLPPEILYRKTGIQKQNFNTLYQLYCEKESGRLQKAKSCLMIPAYLSYLLTGVVANEYTNASTTGMLDATQKTWDKDILTLLGVDDTLFGELKLPGDYIGHFTDEMKAFAGFDAAVVFAPSHDTAAAVAACPLKENALYISSGTWSLVGMEIAEPILTDEARAANFTNEGGVDYRFRFLKNYMGMWLFQNIRRNLGGKYSYQDLMLLAQESDTVMYFDVNDPRLTAPDSMIDAVKDCLNTPNLPLSDLLNCVYHSLARGYQNAVCEIESITKKTVSALCIVGGGSKDTYLNSLAAKYTQKPVYTGPVEATGTGNIIAQLMYSCECSDLDEARSLHVKQI